MIPQHQIEQIKEAANDDIIAIVGDYVKLKRSGSSHKGLCPFHEENTASFSVSESKGIYKCFGCGQGGDAVDFFMKMEGLDFIEAIRELADRQGIFIREEESNRPKQQRQNLSMADEIIPGISEMKSRIRKEGYVIVLLDKKASESFQDKDSSPWIRLDLPIGDRQAKIITKYADKCLFRTYESMKNERFFQSLQVCLRQGLNVYILQSDTVPHVEKSDFSGSLSFPYEDGWLQYLLTHFGPDESLKREIIITLACIDDDISRKIHTQYFIDHWNQKFNQ